MKVGTDEWLGIDELAAYAKISRSSAYELAHTLGARRRLHVGLRVRRSAVDSYLDGSSQQPATRKPGRGTRIASARSHEAVPGMTEAELIDKAGF